MSTLDDAGRFTVAAGRLMERDGAKRFKQYGLTLSDMALLARLVRLGPMTPGEFLESSVLLSAAPVVSHTSIGSSWLVSSPGGHTTPTAG
jgi:hypothetical protein